MMAGVSTEDLGYLSLALFFNTFTAPAVKLTQTADGQYAYNKYCIYFIAEIMKLTVAGGYSAWLWQTKPETRKTMKFTTREALQYALPGFVFFTQNNLSFIALQHMSSAAFQLLLNMRIVFTAILTVIVIRKPLNKVKWFAIILMTNGAIQYQLSGCSVEGSSGLKTDSQGLFVMALIVTCAAGGNIVNQMLLQKSPDQPLMMQNAILYSWGVAMNGFNWFYSTTAAGGGAPALGEFGGAALFLCAFNAVYGLSISVILKRFGSLTRTFIQTAAIVFNAILDTMFFGETLSVLEATTFLTIFASIFLFTILGEEWEKTKKTTSPPPEKVSDAEAANATLLTNRGEARN